MAQNLVEMVLEGGESVEKMIEEVYRLGEYVEDGARPMKIKNRS